MKIKLQTIRRKTANNKAKSTTRFSRGFSAENVRAARKMAKAFESIDHSMAILTTRSENDEAKRLASTLKSAHILPLPTHKDKSMRFTEDEMFKVATWPMQKFLPTIMKITSPSSGFIKNKEVHVSARLVPALAEWCGNCQGCGEAIGCGDPVCAFYVEDDFCPDGMMRIAYSVSLCASCVTKSSDEICAIISKEIEKRLKEINKDFAIGKNGKSKGWRVDPFEYQAMADLAQTVGGYILRPGEVLEAAPESEMTKKKTKVSKAS